MSFISAIIALLNFPSIEKIIFNAEYHREGAESRRVKN
jgi:hypothetical protein